MTTKPENYVYCARCKRRYSWLRYSICSKCFGGCGIKRKLENMKKRVEILNKKIKEIEG